MKSSIFTLTEKERHHALSVMLRGCLGSPENCPTCKAVAQKLEWPLVEHQPFTLDLGASSSEHPCVDPHPAQPGIGAPRTPAASERAPGDTRRTRPGTPPRPKIEQRGKSTNTTLKSWRDAPLVEADWFAEALSGPGAVTLADCWAGYKGARWRTLHALTTWWRHR